VFSCTGIGERKKQNEKEEEKKKTTDLND